MRLSGSARFAASSWSVGSIWDKSGPPSPKLISQQQLTTQICRRTGKGERSARTALTRPSAVIGTALGHGSVRTTNAAERSRGR